MHMGRYLWIKSFIDREWIQGLIFKKGRGRENEVEREVERDRARES